VASLFSISLGVIAHAKADPWVHRPLAAPSAPIVSNILMQCGIASWYGHHWRGRRTASGVRFNDRKFTAANPSLPFKTKARVTNLANGRSVEVVVNDRGPYIAGRIIDLSAGAARALGMLRNGLADVAISAALAPGRVITR
jgi:rare lipoprotein A